MGFGTLFFGYFAMFAFTLSPYYFFADILGAIVAIWAYVKLSEYNRYFRGAWAATFVFLILCGVNAASLMFTLYETGGDIDLGVSVGKEIAACVMHVFFFLGTRGICLGAEAKKLAAKCDRNFVMTMFAYLATFAVLALNRVIGDELGPVGFMLLIYRLICIVLNLALIYQCFGILMPADEDEDQKKRSRFAFINALSDKFDAIDDAKNEYRRQSMKMAMDEADRLRAEKQKKNGKRNTHKKKK
ncbi:MAG: hypothetical protein IKX19_01785 [Clostridia bacterium]|nr:hypothetical protein [Clostridia bacterium]